MKRIFPAFLSSLITFFLLSAVHVNTKITMLVAERFVKGGGWAEIVIISVYSGFLYYRMSDKKQTARWRTISWLIFSVVFFGQLIPGLIADSRFLLTGELHLPVPAMILGGSLYRMNISFMPVLFLSAILITGPAWCSHLCYFGAIDNRLSDGRGLRNTPLKNKTKYRFTVLFLFIFVTLVLRIFRVDVFYAALFGGIFGITGLMIILLISRKKKKMVNCIAFCPVGTITSFLKYISPFRMSIADSCTTCLACTLKCKYDALNLDNIKKRRPGITCTYCGDCLSSCHGNSIRYHFAGLKPETARSLYLLLTISIHAVFLALGRI